MRRTLTQCMAILPWVAAMAYAVDEPRVDEGVSVMTLPDRPSVAIPLHHAGGFLLTDPVTVNGQPIGRLIVDTGISRTYIAEAAFRRLRLPPAGAVLQSAGTGVTHMHRGRADTIEIGEITVRNHLLYTGRAIRFVACSQPPVGLLGGDILARTPFTIDYNVPSLTLHRRADFRPPEGVPRYPLTFQCAGPLFDAHSLANPSATTPCIDAVVDGNRHGVFQIDTASRGIHLPPVFARTWPDCLGVFLQTDAGREWVVSRYVCAARVMTIRFCGETFGDLRMPQIWFAVERDLSGVVVAAESMGIIGGDILERFRLTFDYENASLWAEPVTPRGVRELLGRGLDLTRRDAADMTPLMAAVYDNRADDAVALIEAGASLDDRGGEGYSLLHAAIRNHSDETAVALLDAGARIPRNDCMSAMATVLMRGDAALFDRLTSRIPMPNDTPSLNEFLVCAAAGGNTTLLERILIAHPDAKHALQEDGLGTALHTAVLGKCAECVPMLLESGIPVDSSAGPGGRTPLMLAAMLGDARLTRVLLEHGANPNAQSAMKPPFTALHLAAASGSRAVVELLVEAGADIDAVGPQGRTPLMLAASAVSGDTADALLAAGADPAKRDIFGQTLFGFACERGHAAIVNRLLNDAPGFHRSLVNACGPRGAFPPVLIRAAANGHVDVVRLLLAFGADVDRHEPTTGVTPLHVAALNGRSNVVDVLLEHKANPNARDYGGRTPLMAACHWGDPSVVKALLRAGASPGTQDHAGFTALDRAVRANNKAAVAALPESDR